MTPIPPKLFYFQCSLCKTVASSPVFASTYKCGVCLRWMGFLYSTAAVTDEQMALVRRGLVMYPHTPEPQPWRCVRCGVEFQDIRPRYRVDGKCCTECVTAEVMPKVERRSRETADEDQERLEAAYRAAERE